MNNKIYLIISTDEKELPNIKELTSVWEHFDGLGVCFHGSEQSDAYKLILERLKDGFVTRFDQYWGQHAHDLNSIILHPKIKIGDWLLKLDSSERCAENFAYNIRPFIRMLENNGCNTLYQRSKALMFKRFPHQYAVNTPHYGIVGLRQNILQLEQQSWFKSDLESCYSLRKERQPYSWINHYLSYYLICDSNHSLLGAHHFGPEQEVFQQKEQIRYNFLLLLQKLGINNDKDSLINYWRNNPLTPEMRLFVDNVRILNDAYLYNILGDTDLTDDIVRPCKQIT